MPNLSDDMQQAKSGDRDGNHLGRGHHTGSFSLGCTSIRATLVPRIDLKHLIILSYLNHDCSWPRAAERTRFWCPHQSRGHLRHVDAEVVTIPWRPMLIAKWHGGPSAADDRLSMERPAVDVQLPWMTLRLGRRAARSRGYHTRRTMAPKNASMKGYIAIGLIGVAVVSVLCLYSVSRAALEDRGRQIEWTLKVGGVVDSKLVIKEGTGGKQGQ